jgi:hypothetical protein
MNAWFSFFCVAIVGLLPIGHSSRVSGRPSREPAPLVVTVTPWGPSQTAIDHARAVVESHPLVREYLDRTTNRFLSFDLLDSPVQGEPPNGFRATFFDYTNDRAIVATGLLNRPESLTVKISFEQPLPSGEEFDAAVAVVERDPVLGPSLADGSLEAYRSMPPVLESTTTNNERTLTVGLRSTKHDSHEIVGVMMARDRVVRFANGAPPAAAANSSQCGIPGAGQPTTPRGTAGQFQVTVTQGSTTLWSMLVIRPSVSSGLRASGLEVQNVDYLGKRVMKRGHVPILNVKYVNNGCGPYRDWQWQEGRFQADGTDVAPGIRNTVTPAQTILDNGTDVGNFAGVAYYTTDNSLVMVTELEAGWYRYIQEWHFESNGTIRPRFRFGGTFNSCICITHIHHAYFRFDFDIVTSNKNAIWEINGRWNPIRRNTEMMSLRSPTGNRRWLVENTASGEKYMIVPGEHDGLTDVYGRGDLWLLAFNGSELDDGHNSTGGETEAQLDDFVNGESLNGDLVVWYAGHSVHEGGHEAHDEVHAVGPDLIPVVW